MDRYNPDNPKTQKVIELIAKYRENQNEELVDQILKLMEEDRNAECKGLLEIIKSEVVTRKKLLRRYVDYKHMPKE